MSADASERRDDRKGARGGRARADGLTCFRCLTWKIPVMSRMTICRIGQYLHARARECHTSLGGVVVGGDWLLKERRTEVFVYFCGRFREKRAEKCDTKTFLTCREHTHGVARVRTRRTSPAFPSRSPSASSGYHPARHDARNGRGCRAAAALVPGCAGIQASRHPSCAHVVRETPHSHCP